MTKMFKIRVMAQDKEELDKRVKDNESRGFTVHKYFEQRTPNHYGEAKRSRPGAIMQRPCDRQ